MTEQPYSDLPVGIAPSAWNAMVVRLAERDKMISELLSVLDVPDNGHHYCRSCRAGTANGWAHDEYCTINNRTQRINEVRNRARAMIGAKP